MRRGDQDAACHDLHALADLHAHAIPGDRDSDGAAAARHDPQPSLGVGVVDDLAGAVVHVEIRGQGGEEARVVVPPYPPVFQDFLRVLPLLLTRRALRRSGREVVQQPPLALLGIADECSELRAISLHCALHAAVNMPRQVSDDVAHGRTQPLARKGHLRQLRRPAVLGHGPRELLPVLLSARRIGDRIEVEGPLREVGLVSQLLLPMGPASIVHRLFVLQRLQAALAEMRQRVGLAQHICVRVNPTGDASNGDDAQPVLAPRAEQLEREVGIRTQVAVFDDDEVDRHGRVHTETDTIAFAVQKA
mmetsp:Transcript_126775/g.355024  ORF Transcript_126775/g.355024 Transcript_126775/m.355024 type:complete len:305 (+) Transcript_126775:316-1230(+)